VVKFCGLAATGVGLVLILTLPVTWLGRAVAACVWLLVNARQMRRLSNGHKQCQRIRIGHTGEVEVTTTDGCCLPATLVSGSVVLSRAAWIRLESDDGRRFAELLYARRPQNEQWRRLQVIWRHLGAGR